MGEAWGRQARAGWVIGLSGDLGAGKTQLVKGIAAGLGVMDRVHSPTFSILNAYQGGRFPLFHIDLYRLSTGAEIAQAGLEEYLHSPPGLTVVEWIDRWLPDSDPMAIPSQPWNPGGLRRVWMEWLGENQRRIAYEDFGS